MAIDRVDNRDSLGHGAFSITLPKRWNGSCLDLDLDFFFFLEGFELVEMEDFSRRGRFPPASSILCRLAFLPSSFLSALFF